LKHGENLTLMQRIGFTVFSLVLFSFGVLFLGLAASDIRNAEYLGAIGWSLPTLCFLVPGIWGLRNVLRF